MSPHFSTSPCLACRIVFVFGAPPGNGVARVLEAQSQGDVADRAVIEGSTVLLTFSGPAAVSIRPPTRASRPREEAGDARSRIFPPAPVCSIGGVDQPERLPVRYSRGSSKPVRAPSARWALVGGVAGTVMASPRQAPARGGRCGTIGRYCDSAPCRRYRCRSAPASCTAPLIHFDPPGRSRCAPSAPSDRRPRRSG